MRSTCCGVEPQVVGAGDEVITVGDSRRTETTLCEDNHTGRGATEDLIDRGRCP